MIEMTYDELLEQFHENVHQQIKESVERNRGTHVVMAVNQQLDSSRCGEKTAMCVGPDCTYKTPDECEGKWLNDLPSQRQYFTHFAEVGEDMAGWIKILEEDKL